MKLFGIVNSFDNDMGHGSIKPETGGVDLGFERSAISWDAKDSPPTAGQRLSYDVGTNKDSKPCALNLKTI
jgi:cold shock CspA family protein